MGSRLNPRLPRRDVVGMSSTSAPEPRGPETFAELAAAALRLLGNRVPRLSRPALVGADPRARLRCLLTLLVITALSLGLAAAVWNAAVDHRLRLSTSGEDGGRDLRVGLEQREQRAVLEAAPARSDGRYRARPGDPGTVRDDFRGRASAAGTAPGDGASLSGAALAAPAALLVLLAGLLTGRVVLRRLRAAEATEEDPEQPHRPCADAAADVEPESDEPVDGPDQDDVLPAAAQDVAADPTQAAQDGPVDVPEPALVPARAPDPDPAPPARLPEGALPQQRGPAPDFAPRQRLYERRRSPRTPLTLEAQLRWLGSEWSVSVLEMNDGGLSLTTATPLVTPGRRNPARAGDHVRVRFGTPLGPVHASAQIAWERRVGGGVSAGLRFTGLSGDDLDRVLALCAAHAPQAQALVS